jgi:hypothetical protein
MFHVPCLRYMRSPFQPYLLSHRSEPTSKNRTQVTMFLLVTSFVTLFQIRFKESPQKSLSNHSQVTDCLMSYGYCWLNRPLSILFLALFTIWRTDLTEVRSVVLMTVRTALLFWVVTPCRLVDRNVFAFIPKHGDSIKIRAFWDVAPCSLVLIRRRSRGAVMMEAVRTFETSVYSDTTRRYIPEGSNLHTRRRENFKYHTMTVCSSETLISIVVFRVFDRWLTGKSSMRTAELRKKEGRRQLSLPPPLPFHFFQQTSGNWLAPRFLTTHFRGWSPHGVTTQENNTERHTGVACLLSSGDQIVIIIFALYHWLRPSG